MNRKRGQIVQKLQTALFGIYIYPISPPIYTYIYLKVENRVFFYFLQTFYNIFP